MYMFCGTKNSTNMIEHSSKVQINSTVLQVFVLICTSKSLLKTSVCLQWHYSREQPVKKGHSFSYFFSDFSEITSSTREKYSDFMIAISNQPTFTQWI